jgi:hypothetical protein
MPLLVGHLPAAGADASSAVAPSHTHWRALQLGSEKGVSSRSAIAASSTPTTPVWLTRLLGSSFYRQAAKTLIHAPLHESLTLTDSAPTLVYVNQREIALVKPGVVEWVGSGDATTCVIVILRCARTQRCFATHLDGADRAQIFGSASPPGGKKELASFASALDVQPAAKSANSLCTSMLDALNALTLEDLAEGVDVHICGGFQTHVTARAEGDVEEQGALSSSSDGDEATGEGERSDDEDAAAADQTDGLVQVRDVLWMLSSYANASPVIWGSRLCEMRLQNLCVGPINTQWEADSSITAPASASAASASSHSAVSAKLNAAQLAAPLSYPRPFLTSLFLHIQSGRVEGRFPYTREERGPEMTLRAIRSIASSEPGELVHAYVENSDEFVVPAFEYPRWNAQGLKALLALPDAEFALRCSTSPLVEPPFFIPDMRALYGALVNIPKRSSQRKVFRRAFEEGNKASANLWKLVQ